MRLRNRELSILAAATAVLVAGLARADVFNMDGTQKSLEFVTVGDPGNTGDTRVLDYGSTGHGAVSYTYQMGKYDVTAAQYTQFLNAVAKTDTFGLYNAAMSNPPTSPNTVGCGITRSGDPGNYTYATILGHEDFPVNYVSWGDAVRFCNWLQNGQLDGPQGPDTTETGAYTLHSDIYLYLRTVARNAGATYFLPSEEEWYKAAYYKGGGLNAGYWAYATRSDSLPSNVLSETGTNNANYNGDYYDSDDHYTDPTNYLTSVGAFKASPGPYGTYDQVGNMSQWTEERYDAAYGYDERGVRGAPFSCHNPWFMNASGDGAAMLDLELDHIGFRVASVPEPGSLALLSGVAAMLLLHSWRRRSV